MNLTDVKRAGHAVMALCAFVFLGSLALWLVPLWALLVGFLVGAAALIAISLRVPPFDSEWYRVVGRAAIAAGLFVDLFLTGAFALARVIW